MKPMKKIRNLILTAGIFALIFLSGCLKPEQYPDTPQIEFQNFYLGFDTGQYASKGVLVITFTDGNGDIGLNSGDTFPPYQRTGDYYYNYVINYFEKQNGVFKKIDFTIPFSTRIPVLTPDNPGKAIKGIISDTMTLNPKPTYDTIKFEAFIYDRALHKSNTIATPEIIVKRR
jgi:hypothetical protein